MAKDAKWYAEWLRLATAPTEDERRFIIEIAEFIESLAAELEAVERERDAAVEKYKRMKNAADILSEAVDGYAKENGGADDA